MSDSESMSGEAAMVGEAGLFMRLSNTGESHWKVFILFSLADFGAVYFWWWGGGGASNSSFICVSIQEF